ncbi:hypothetical protein DIPPA_18248 [Diplonema papillatum]|nr:hypothetical protein DIPPA_18248 [Diplonema papillatum]|eukprot:gene409-586_t
MGPVEAFKQKIEANEFHHKAAVALEGGKQVYATPDGVAVTSLTDVVEQPHDAAIALQIEVNGDVFQVHAKYEHDGCVIATGRQPVDSKDAGVPTPDGWTLASKDGVTLFVTYPIHTISARVIRELVACF